MKKLLLSCSLVAASFAANAQIYSAADTADFINWTYVDLDGDGFNFIRTAITNPALTNFNGKQGILSRSWNPTTQAPLTPDNLIVSPPINCSGQNTVWLNWTVGSPETTASGWQQEHYAMYIVKPSDLPAALAGNIPAPAFETTISVGEIIQGEAVNVSSMAANQTVHIVIRHFECTDENFIFFDNVELATVASTEEITSEMQIKAYPNPASETFNIAVDATDAISATIYSLDGKVVATQEFNGSQVTFDVANLEAGAYTYEVITASGEVHRNKFIKE